MTRTALIIPFPLLAYPLENQQDLKEAVLNHFNSVISRFVPELDFSIKVNVDKTVGKDEVSISVYWLEEVLRLLGPEKFDELLWQVFTTMDSLDNEDENEILARKSWYTFSAHFEDAQSRHKLVDLDVKAGTLSWSREDLGACFGLARGEMVAGQIEHKMNEIQRLRDEVRALVKELEELSLPAVAM